MSEKKVKWNEAQLSILDFDKGNMIVSASAGSGKTTVMLERVLRLLDKGTPIDRIVILAFNKSIASEIRAKLYKKISDKVETGIESGEDVSFLAEQLDNINLANIVTNDSYCSRTVKEFFAVLGIDPATSVLGEKEGDILYSKCYNTAIDRLIDAGEMWIHDLMSKFDGRKGLLGQIKEIHTFVGTVPDANEWLQRVTMQVYGVDIDKDNDIDEQDQCQCDGTLESSKAIEYLVDMVVNRCEYAISLMDEIIANAAGDEKIIEKYTEVKRFFADVASKKKYSEIYPLVQAYKFPRPDQRRKDVPFDKEFIKERHGQAKDILPWLQAILNIRPELAGRIHRKTAEDIGYLMRVYMDTEELFVKEKANQNKYEFADFMQKTLELLADPEIAKSVSQRYDYICVDEYQDTNYAQEEIFNKISNGNNLFMVGDSKQSIYKFRLSEPQIMIDKYDSYAEDRAKGKTVHLDYNYRSNRQVVDFVNRVFDVIMTKNIAGIDYQHCDQLRYGADYRDLPEYEDGERDIDREEGELYHSDAQRPPFYSIDLFYDAKQPGDTVALNQGVYSVEEDHSSEDNVQKGYEEGKFVARSIKSMVGRAKIYDPDIKGERVVQYRDIAILAKSNSSICKQVIRAIQDSQIPIDTAPLTKADEMYEVDIIKQMLTVISNDRDDMALAAVLSSYWVGMDSQDLYDIRIAHPQCKYFFEACQKEDKTNEKLSKLYDMIAEYRLKSSYVSVYELAGELVYRYGYDKYLLSLSDGKFKLFAVKKYLQGLQSLGYGVSLHEYVENIGTEKYDKDNNAGGNMVQAMTIHKSKGLEFPIVFLVDIDNSIDKSGGYNAPKMQLDKDMGVAINYFDKDTRQATDNLVFRVFSEKKKFDERAEAMRLLYVALTRAKNHIFLTGTTKDIEIGYTSPYKVNSFLEWLYNVASKDEKVKSLIKVHSQDQGSECSREVYTFREYKGDSLKDIDRYLDYEYPYEENKKIGIKYTVTEINHIDSYEDDIATERVDGEPDFVGNKATRGTNYHAILEHIDYDRYSVEEVKAQLAEMVEKNILTAEQLDNVDPEEIARVLASPLIRLAAENKYYREREFMLCVKACEVLPTSVEDKVLVQGAVDLIIKAGEELYVVDFKKTKASEEVVRARYHRQLELYSLAVSEAMNMPVTHSLIYVIGRDQVIEF